MRVCFRLKDLRKLILITFCLFTVLFIIELDYATSVDEVKYYCCGSSEKDNVCTNANWNEGRICPFNQHNIWASCCINKISDCVEKCVAGDYSDYKLVMYRAAAQTDDPLTYCKCSDKVGISREIPEIKPKTKATEIPTVELQPLTPELQCGVILRTDCPTSHPNKILGLSNLTNAHIEDKNNNKYPYSLCCQHLEVNPTTNDEWNFAISNKENAHIELNKPDEQITYTYSSRYVFNYLKSDNCGVDTVEDIEKMPEEVIKLLYVSSLTNAHISAFNVDISDEQLIFYCTHSDTDNDGLKDYEEVNFFSSLGYSKNWFKQDLDKDGYLNGPLDKDTDGDGLDDSFEIATHNLSILYRVDTVLAIDNEGNVLENAENVYTCSKCLLEGTCKPTIEDPIFKNELINGLDVANNDTDGDGLLDGEEVNKVGTDPCNPDTDKDFLSDKDELRSIEETEEGPTKDVEEGTWIGMAIKFVYGYAINIVGYVSYISEVSSLPSEKVELTYYTNPFLVDTDGDGLLDSEETRVDVEGRKSYKIYSTKLLLRDGTVFRNTLCQNKKDIIFVEKDFLGSRIYLNPLKSDTDDDGLGDWIELCDDPLTNPNSSDTDNDGLSDLSEIADIYDRSEIDWDNDGSIDYKTNPNANDTDNDGLSDSEELSVTVEPLINDTDDDSLLDGDEVKIYYTNPQDPDSDDDTLLDNEEVSGSIIFTECIKAASLNPNWLATDCNTNASLLDTDGDGLTDSEEVYAYITNPSKSDTDSDNLTDNVEVDYFLELGEELLSGDIDEDGKINGPNDDDTDGDTLDDFSEKEYGTSLVNNDSDDDGLLDGFEIFINDVSILTSGEDKALEYSKAYSATCEEGVPLLFDPTNYDTDDDDLSDSVEYAIFTSSCNSDTDNDNLDDSFEIETQTPDEKGRYRIDTVIGTYNCIWESGKGGLDAINSDSDKDGLTDGEEVNIHGTDPCDPDTDDDKLTDGEEIKGITGMAAASESGATGEATWFTGFIGWDEEIDEEEAEESVPTKGSNPFSNDTDEDGLSDYDEVKVFGTNANSWDTDNDGMDDGWEMKYSSNKTYSEGKGICIFNVSECLDPKVDNSDKDYDEDGLSNEEEYKLAYNPVNPYNPPIIALTAKPASGQPPLDVEFDINLISSDIIKKYVLHFEYEDYPPTQIDEDNAYELLYVDESIFGAIKVLDGETKASYSYDTQGNYTVVLVAERYPSTNEGNDTISKLASITSTTIKISELPPLPEDADGDSILDADDNCITSYNPNQADEDSDGIGTSCDSCSSTPLDETVDEFGCSDSQKEEPSMEFEDYEEVQKCVDMGYVCCDECAEGLYTEYACQFGKECCDECKPKGVGYTWIIMVAIIAVVSVLLFILYKKGKLDPVIDWFKGLFKRKPKAETFGGFEEKF